MRQPYQEPRADIEDPQDSFCPCVDASETPAADVHDEFIRLMGGDKPVFGGHAKAVAHYKQMTAMPAKTVDSEFYHGPVGIIAPVYQRRPAPEMSGPVAAPQSIRKTSKAKPKTSLPT